MKYTPEQRHQCICKMVPIIAKHEGWEVGEGIVELALDLGDISNPRLKRWIETANLCLDAVEKHSPKIMSNKFNPNCITYSVDPNALKAGIPVESLEKQNIRVYDRPETMDDYNRYLSSNKRLFDEPGRYRIPQPQELKNSSTSLGDAPLTRTVALKQLHAKQADLTKCKKPKGCPPQIMEIHLESADFLRVSQRQIIKIPNTVKIGNKFCLVDKRTGRWMVKTLHSVVGDYGYWV